MSTFYEFFAGGGMARAGLGPDWQCLFANDISEKKGSAYRKNWGGSHLVVSDVFDVETNQLPGHVDLAWGSFPCQDLSLAGNGIGLQGHRSGAFWGFWKIVQTLNVEQRKPRIIVLENVYGTLTSHEGKDFQQIANAISEEGYVFGAVVVDAVHFVPQSRPRLFIIGIDQDLHIPGNVIADIASPIWHPAALRKAFKNLSDNVKESWRWWNIQPPDERVLSFDEIIEDEPEGVQWHSQEHTDRLISMMSDVNRRKVLDAQNAGVPKVGTIYRRTREGVQRAEIRFDGVAGCLRTPSGGSSRQTIMIVNGESVRSRLISPREMARLMGLNDTYVLPDRYNDAYHLLGDGVVATVVEHLKTSLLDPVLAVNIVDEAPVLQAVNFA